MQNGTRLNPRQPHNLAPHSMTHPLLSVLTAALAGIRYGTKIRLPHATVMVLLFAQGTLRDRIKRIARLTLQHASRLGAFAGLYKALLIILGANQSYSLTEDPDLGKKLWRLLRYGPSPSAGLVPAHPWQALVAGATAGALVWDQGDSISTQLTLYLSSRIAWALWKRGNVPSLSSRTTAALAWGLVLWLFEYHADLLHPSLRASMEDIYRV